MTNGSSFALHGYLANSPLVSQIGFANASAWMTTTRGHDFLNRLTAITDQPSGTLVCFEAVTEVNSLEILNPQPSLFESISWYGTYVFTSGDSKLRNYRIENSTLPEGRSWPFAWAFSGFLNQGQ